jgi:small subunit ribosomal protein S8
VDIPASRLKREMARILTEQGYIDGFDVESPTAGPSGRAHPRPPEVHRRPPLGDPGLRRVSRPGQRRYVPAAAVPKVQGGLGTAIVSTSRGVMTGHDARQQKVGGEVVAEVW